MNRKLFSLIAIFFLVISCSTKSDYLTSPEKVRMFTRDDFDTLKQPQAEIIPFDKSLNPRSYRILRDSILIVELLKSSSLDYWMEVYRFPTMELLGKILPRGKGPGEFMTVEIKYQSCKDEFIIHDIVKNEMAIFNLDSVLLHFDDYTPNQISISQDIGNFAKLNDSIFIGYNTLFLNDSDYTNSVDELFFFKRNGNPISYKGMEDFDFFTSNVSRGDILIGPDSHEIFVANTYVDIINIYDQNLNILRQLHGPDQIFPKYKIIQNKMVVFDEKTIETYKYSWYTENYIYLLYNGSNKEKNDVENSFPLEHLYSPMELFKLNWNGELLTHYELDRYLFEISIDCKEEYLYGTHWKKYGEEYPKLIRYEL